MQELFIVAAVVRHEAEELPGGVAVLPSFLNDPVQVLGQHPPCDDRSISLLLWAPRIRLIGLWEEQ
jgi:hypothetical protein